MQYCFRHLQSVGRRVRSSFGYRAGLNSPVRALDAEVLAICAVTRRWPPEALRSGLQRILADSRAFEGTRFVPLGLFDDGGFERVAGGALQGERGKCRTRLRVL